MPIALQLIQIGDETGVILPDEVIFRWDLKAGDDVLLAQSGDSVLLEFAGQSFKELEKTDKDAPR